MIAKAVKPVARLAPVELAKADRKPSALKGKLAVAEDLDTLLSGTLPAAFERNRIAAIENHAVVPIAASLLT